MISKKIILEILFFLIIVPLSFRGQTLAFDWVKQFGGSSGSNKILSMDADVQGNIYTLGTYSGTVDFDPSPGTYTLNSAYSSFICKQDSTGGLLWVKQLSAVVEDMIVGKGGTIYIIGRYFDTIDVDPGPGVYNLAPCYAYYPNSIFVLKLNTNGIFNWASRYGTTEFSPVPNAGWSIGLDSLQNVYTSSNFQSTISFFNSDTIVNSLYAPTWGGPPDGVYPYYSNVYLCKMDTNGRFVLAVAKTASENDAGKAIVNSAGEAIMFGSGGNGGFIMKYDATGHLLWSKDLSTAVAAASVDRAGYISLAGTFTGLVDFDPGPGVYDLGTSGSPPSLFVLQLDGSGNFNWARRIDNLDNANSPWLEVRNDAARNLYVTGSFQGTVNFDPQGPTSAISSTAGSGFILRYNYYGGVDWVKQVGQNSTSQINSMALDGFGNLYTGGSFSGTVDFDPGSGIANLNSLGSTDGFVHKLGNEQLITGIKKQNWDENSLHIFPNPTADIVYVQLDKTLEQVSYKLIDITGRVMQENKNVSGSSFALNLSEQAMGIYVLEISDAKTIARVKVIKN